MPDNQRIEDLRRRVQKDPASIAFAQLAEELRRAGRHGDAVDACNAGLAIHPGYLSARVTLGRALIELNHLDEAQAQLELVLRGAPENLAAIRGLAEIHHRRGELRDALKQYRAALALARNDPDLQRTVDELSREVEPQKPAASSDGLTFEQAQQEFLKHAPPPPAPAVRAPAVQAAPPPQGPPIVPAPAALAAPPQAPPTEAAPAAQVAPLTAPPVAPAPLAAPEVAPPPELSEPVVVSSPAAATDDVARERAGRTIAALDQWLDAIHAARTERRP
jgi:tetratricopeptide (TPR) repeat protein